MATEPDRHRLILPLSRKTSALDTYMATESLAIRSPKSAVVVSQGRQSTRSGDRGAHLRCSDAGLARFGADLRGRISAQVL